MALYAVSGPTPVLPRFARGNWWTRYHPYTAQEYLEPITRFADEGIPFSVSVLDMDWHLVDIDPEYGSGWTGYSWNRELFGDPAGFLQWLRDKGLRVTLNVHPADGVRAFEDVYPQLAQVRVGTRSCATRSPSTSPTLSFSPPTSRSCTAHSSAHRGGFPESIRYGC